MPKHHFPSPADNGDNIVFEINGLKIIGQGWVVDTLFDTYKVLDLPLNKYMKGFVAQIPHASQLYDFFVVDSHQLEFVLALKEFENCALLASEEFLRPLFNSLLAGKY